MIFIGIDLGLDGAIAMLRDDGTLLDVRDMPSLEIEGTKKTPKGNLKVHRVIHLHGLTAILEEAKASSDRVEAVFEKVNAGVFAKGKGGEQRTMGVVSSFNFGWGAGGVEGLLVGLGIPYNKIHPATWKAAVLKGTGKNKDASVQLACQLFPNHAPRFAWQRGKVACTHDGRAEASLLAYWALRQAPAVTLPPPIKGLRLMVGEANRPMQAGDVVTSSDFVAIKGL